MDAEKEVKEHEQKDMKSFQELAERLSRVEKKLGLHEKPKSRDEIMHERKRS